MITDEICSPIRSPIRSAIRRGFGPSLGNLGPLRDFNFAQLAFPTAGMTFTRATAATVTDHQGVVWQCASGEMRIAGARRVENLLASTETLSTQSVTVEVGRTYFLSFGPSTGSIALSGAASGTLAGSAGARVQTSLTASTTSLTLTVTGSVLQGQLELAAPGQVAPSEYVSRGVLSSPFHGFFADGVRYFATNAAGGAITPQGVLIEEGATNAIRNSVAAGASPGTPGTAPTNWSFANGAGGAISSSVIGSGLENGQPYLDIRIFGTSGGSNFFDVNLEGIATVAASVGQVWTMYATVRLVAGSSAGVNGFYTVQADFNSGAYISETVGTNVVPGALLQRSIGTRTAVATTTHMQPRLRVQFVSAAAVDITLRISQPQMEQKAFATSYVPTTGAAATRNADILDIAHSPWLTPTAGTWVVDAIRPSGTADYAIALEGESVGASAQGCTIGNNEVSNNGVNIVQRHGAVRQDRVRMSVPAETPVRMGLAWDAAGSTAATVGAVLGAGFAPGQSDYGTHIAVGRRGGVGATGGGAWNRPIGRVRFWPSRLPDATIQALTA